MALDLSALTKYVDEEKLPLIRKSLLEGRTVSMINIQPGIKHSATIKQFATSVLLEAGACGFNSTDATSVTQKVITVCPLQSAESICPRDMEEYILGKRMSPGSYPTDLKPIEGIYAEEKAALNQQAIELISWRGDTVAGTGNLALCDGFLKISNDEGNFITSGTGAITSATVIDDVNAMVALIPVDIVSMTTKTIFVGYDVYNLYTQALVNANLFHYAPTDGPDYTYQVPGSDVKIVAVRGLNGTGEMFLTYTENMYMGTVGE